MPASVPEVPVGTSSATLSAPLGALRRLRERTGLALLCVDAQTGVRVVEPDGDLPPFFPDAARSHLSVLTHPSVFPLTGGLTGYAAPLPGHGGRFVAYGFQASGGVLPPDVIIAAATAGWTSARLDRWAAGHARCSPGPLKALLDLAVSELELERSVAAQQAKIEQLGEQIHQTYEEISLLHTLTRNLQISRGPIDLARLCLDRMPELIDAEGHVVRIDAPGDIPRTLTRGVLPFVPEEIASVVAGLGPQEAARPIVRNHVNVGSLAGRHPGIRNIVAAPLREGRHRFGWIASVNLSGGREFGTVEASFLNTIATILGTHLRNIDLLREHNDLLVGFVRSLVSTLDAKDPYTRGHSERVALIARRVGREMGLADEELKAIHLSGLLHDIGKIGVDDRILRKAGPLTDEEFDQVKKHPMIGYNILSGLKNLRHVLPGVRSHHENYDGSGYPDGLAGEGIPLLARILAVADGYDAMGSDRPYRKGMAVEKIDEIFRRGAGQQWDLTVLEAYFRCRDDIRLLCGAYSLDSGCPVGGVEMTV